MTALRPHPSAASDIPPHASHIQINHASSFDAMRVLLRVVLPTFAKGVVRRRAAMESMAARWNLDLKAVRLMQRLRRKYGSGALYLPLPLRPHLLLLDPADVNEVLERSPVPFATATREKRAALSHFEPDNVLISTAPQRVRRRPFHDQALAPEQKVHPLAQRFKRVVDEELAVILDCEKAGLFGCLSWETFSCAWFRIVRRVVFGDVGRDDEELTRRIDRLRSRANWAFFLPRNDARLQDFQARLRHYLEHPEAGSLLAMAPRASGIDPESQIAQWLFAFDPAGMATFSALALLATHPHYLRKVRQEAFEAGLDRPFARACFMESLRLWPTTPAILRELTEDTAFGSTHLRQGTGVLIFTPFFHRDSEQLAFAHRMDPSLWIGREVLPARGLVPFSSGPAICPARNLVPLLGSLTMGTVASRMALRLVSPALDPERLPGTLNHFRLQFQMNYLPAEHEGA